MTEEVVRLLRIYATGSQASRETLQPLALPPKAGQ